MRYVTALVLLALMAAGCANHAPGLRGGIVDVRSEEAVTEPTEVTFVYGDGRTSVGLYMPDYAMNVARFDRSSMHFVTEDGWQARTQGRLAVLTHSQTGATIVVARTRYPDLEIASLHRSAREDRNFEAGDLQFDTGVRHETSFRCLRFDAELKGLVYGLQTDLRRADSGVVAIGAWPPQHDERMLAEMPRIIDRMVILDAVPEAPAEAVSAPEAPEASPGLSIDLPQDTRYAGSGGNWLNLDVPPGVRVRILQDGTTIAWHVVYSENGLDCVASFEGTVASRPRNVVVNADQGPDGAVMVRNLTLDWPADVVAALRQAITGPDRGGVCHDSVR